jgi:hydroxymethylglutaryl-CoA reductase (NADPH)
MMTVSRNTALSILARLLDGDDSDHAIRRLLPRLPTEDPLRPRLPAGNDHSKAGLRRRRDVLARQGVTVDHLAKQDDHVDLGTLSGNIENLVGFAGVPVGVVGPLRINGSSAHGDFYVPMATTEGALVASYNRGAFAVSMSGGASVLCLTESVSRAPCFLFESMVDASRFLAWVLPGIDALQEVVDTTSRHCRLIDVRPTLTGKDVYLSFEYQTGDAAGQNMVTIATRAICEHLVHESPVKPQRWFVEGNLSGDKKATMLAFMYARGKKVVAEVCVPRGILRKVVHATPEDMLRYWQVSVLGGALSGSIGVQGHFANALAAIFIACGQDAACVSEASVGLTRMDITPDGDLYMSVSLPNVLVGSVGGGTHLPTARECLDMMGCFGEGGARKLAEICAAMALAGEISIIGALAAGEFASAHARYGRRQPRTDEDV